MKPLKKMLSLFLCMILLLSFFPAVYAEGEGSIAPVEEDEGYAEDGVLDVPPDFRHLRR